MQSHRIPGMVAKDGSLRDKHHIYLAIADSPDGRQLVKAGMAHDPYKRVQGLQTGCPFPIKSFSFVPIGSEMAARDVEALIHKVFNPCRTVGEWFAFDLSDPEHKRIWAGGLPAVLNAKLGEGKWVLSHYDMAAGKEANAARRSLAYSAFKARKARAHNRRKVLAEEQAAKRRTWQATAAEGLRKD